MVASTLHQCIKYMKDGKQRRINGDIRPFGVHEVKYEEARYFNPSEKTRLSEPNRRKLETQTKQVQKAIPTLAKSMSIIVYP
jgi:hypothetical protein